MQVFHLNALAKHILVLIAIAICPKFYLRQCLVRERVTHYKRWVTGSETRIYLVPVAVFALSQATISLKEITPVEMLMTKLYKSSEVALKE